VEEQEKNVPGGIPEDPATPTDDNASATATAVQQALAGKTDDVGDDAGERTPATLSAQLPYLRPEQFRLIWSQRSRVLIELRVAGNPYAIPVNSRQAKNLIRAHAKETGETLRKWEIEEFIEQLIAAAEMAGEVTDVWYRIAPLPCGGFEIDLGDASHTRVRVTAGNVDVITTGSNVVFCRTPTMLPLPMPADDGNLQLLRDKVNLDEPSYLLLITWLTYTLARPKMPSSHYVILVLHGDQGSGKTFLCARVILGLLDPNQLGAQVFPHNAKDLSIMAEHAHVLVFDNMRNFRAAMSDVLCMMSTGGTLSNRALYSNADLYTHHIHGAVVMNGIHHLLTQADLSERCLTLHTRGLPADKRKSEADMIRELERDMPTIFRGLLELTARTLAELPSAEVEQPQRMLDFVRWLAASEKALDLTGPVLQDYYAATLLDAQRDSLMDNLLGNAIVEFAAELKNEWSGTPSALLSTLNERAPFGTVSSREWPSNPIALSKRLNALKASLRTQGIVVEIRRGKERTITIRVEGAGHE
jgi:hypothetical protein